MKKQLFYAIAAAAAFVSCSTDDVVNEAAAGKMGETPIGFNVQKENITRAGTALETQKHYNFGVFAYKVNGKNNADDQLVMDNYLVGWNGKVTLPDGTSTENRGYKVGDLTTTYAATAGTNIDHTSPWFYEGLGTSEYTYDGTGDGVSSTDKYYKKTDNDYMSKNANQYLRYWDLAYTNTNFYCYAPYNKDVTLTHTQGSTSTLTFPDKSIRDGYDMPQNTEYGSYSRTLGEFMYAKQVQATNADRHDVDVNFTHMGAQVLIRFYEDIPGYKVEFIELDGDNGKVKEGITKNYATAGIQATPAVKGDGDTYTLGKYYTKVAATINFTESTATAGDPTYTWTEQSSTKVETPVMFKIPSTATHYETQTIAPANLTSYIAPKNGTADAKTYNRIAEVDQKVEGVQVYSYSPTIYYPVAQPTDSKTGLTFHVSYRIISEDNGEVTTVHNATVHVPYKNTENTLITAWQPNTRYIYTFKITRNSTGYTDPDTEIDPTDATPSPTKALYPIVFDNATIEDYTDNASEYSISEGTNY